MKKADLYLEYLREEGYVPRLDADGDVAFKFEGLSFFLVGDEEDRGFFGLVLPGFWALETPVERARALAAMAKVNGSVKVAKLSLINDSVWAAAEAFYAQPEDFKPTFQRMLRCITHAIRTFGDEMRMDA